MRAILIFKVLHVEKKGFFKRLWSVRSGWHPELSAKIILPDKNALAVCYYGPNGSFSWSGWMKFQKNELLQRQGISHTGFFLRLAETEEMESFEFNYPEELTALDKKKMPTEHVVSIIMNAAYVSFVFNKTNGHQIFAEYLEGIYNRRCAAINKEEINQAKILPFC